MRQFVLKTVVVCLVALVGPTSSRAQQVTVMHWNVHGNLGTFSAQSGPEALAIARILNYLQPDVFLINEVADGAATTNTIAITQWVSTNLPYLASGSYYVSVSTESSSIQRNAVISRYPVANTFTYPDVSSGLRGMFSFQLQLAGTNRLQVFYVHLKCCSDGSSCQTKQDEADLFSGEMADFAATNGSPYIFAGDLNEDNLNPECTLSATYHPIDTLITNGGLAEFKPTTLSGEYRTWSTASTPSIRFDYILAATNRLAPTSGFVFSTKDWAVHGLYTNASAQNLTSDSATASDHYSVFVTYNFPTGTVALAVSPASAFASSGNQGGPFTPTNQIYTLSNISASSINWAATKTANWLTLSATNGNLAGGASTNISVSLNVNANSLSAGNNSDNVVFTNLSNTGDSITRAANLTVNATAGQLAVTPVSGFTFAGLAGGPFAPVSQTYTLSNSGNASLNWTAGNSSNWLTLSATNGSLTVGATTNVSASINANANTLVAGSFSDTISFVNTSSGLGNTNRAVTLTVTNLPGSNSFGFFDDFNTFAAGNLVGQSNWTQLPSIATLPLQIGGGQVVIPFAQSVDNQDAYKNFAVTNGTVFYGLTLTVTNAPSSSTPSYFTALYTNVNAGGFANYRLTARDNGGGTCLLGVRITGQAGDPYTFGTTGLIYGTQHRVIVEADTNGTIAKLFVDPTSANLAAQTAYASNYIGTGTPPPAVGSFVISQFASVAAPNCGVGIGKACVADSFAAVYNFLAPAVPPPAASFSGAPTSGTESLSVTFTDTSTGGITNRFWNFGDGSSTNITTNLTAHAYAAGTYDVMLVVSGPGGTSTNKLTNYITALTAFQSWQLQYFGSTNAPNAAATTDADGDGQNNFTEFLTGTIPTNSASLFRISSVALEGGDVRVSWITGSGRTNALQRAEDAPNGSFSNLATLVTTGSITNYLDAGAATSGPVHFYRVKLLP